MAFFLNFLTIQNCNTVTKTKMTPPPRDRRRPLAPVNKYRKCAAAATVKTCKTEGLPWLVADGWKVSIGQIRQNISKNARNEIYLSKHVQKLKLNFFTLMA